MSEDAWSLIEDQPDEGTAARGRLPDKTYTSRKFANANPNSRDSGEPSRFVYKVVDDPQNSTLVRDGEEWLVTPVEGGRTQIKVLISREAGNIVELWVQRVPPSGAPKTLLRLRREDAVRFADFFRYVENLDPDAPSHGSRIDDAILTEIMGDPDASEALYEAHSERIRALIESDVDARDVIAVSARRAAVHRFRTLLSDDGEFDAAAQAAGGPEAVWQRFFEENPWILGIGLSDQLFTKFSDEKLERVVVGSSVSGVGKRADALLKTAGVVRSMVFAEIKHHRTRLLGEEYRPGTFAPSKELAGGIAQVHGTVQRAVNAIGQRIQTTDDITGADVPGDYTYLFRPRSFLIIGNLAEFTDRLGGHVQSKIMSFELLRRHLSEPEILTFDEVLARAEWLVELAS
ncbi:Shedu immune nuclease family protein [Agromyces humi]|uniref:Shedu immune nuclease family protein n=1 Tax=Agromyces humi TaxID=1766800 RepID=UPI00135C5A6B|nr:Shedu immune nuclease family protein [Agromyces humi]